MTLDYESMIKLFSQVAWPTTRITGLMLSMPVFSSSLVSARIKMAFILAVAFVCAPFVPAEMSFLHFKPIYIAVLFQEFFLGLLMGFVLDLVFQVFVLAGQIVAMQTGLGFATMIDPTSHASVPMVGQLYLLMMTLMFLVLNGHLLLLDAMMRSFELIPVGQVNIDSSTLWRIITFSGWMFKEAVVVSIPAILSILIVNMSFGVMTRVAPQLNIFSLGFPITLMMGFVIIYFSLPGVAAQINDSIEEGMYVIKGMLN